MREIFDKLREDMEIVLANVRLKAHPNEVQARLPSFYKKWERALALWEAATPDGRVELLTTILKAAKEAVQIAELQDVPR